MARPCFAFRTQSPLPLNFCVSANMNSGEREARRAFLIAFIASTFILGGVAFGFLSTFTALPLWACVSIALPLGAAVFIVLLWLGVGSDGPAR